MRIAEQIGARVFSAGYTQMVFPSSHPQYAGMLRLRAPETREALGRADAVLAVGARVFSDFFYNPRPALGERARLIHIDRNPGELGRSEPTDVAILADPKGALTALSDALETEMPGTAIEAARNRAADVAAETRAAQAQFETEASADSDGRPMSPARMMTEIARVLPPDSIVVEDAISSRGALFSAIRFTEPGSVQAEVGAAIGWGMGAALGVKIAEPDRPVVCIVGDGSAMMTVQALWTAASRKLPVVYLVCNNGMYRILKLNMDVYLKQVLGEADRQSRYLGMDFPEPFDLAGIARAFGVAGRRIEDPNELGPAVTAAVDSGEPTVLDVVIDGTV